MTEQNFRRFINLRTVNYLYKGADLEGIIMAWPYQDKFVLTWEECKIGDIYNENNYTRDECHNFSDVDAVIAFLHGRGIEPTFFEL